MVPDTSHQLAQWFIEAVQAEISELEKVGGYERHELLHGRLVSRVTPNEPIFEFRLAGGHTRVPEDANGKLKTQTHEFNAEVISVHVDVIRVRLHGDAVPENIDRAELIVDEIGLLRSLVDVLGEPAHHGLNFGALSQKVFHPSECNVGRAEIPDAIGGDELGEKGAVLQQSLGSDVTFIWGPPGTGKTFVIARLITVLVRAGERVLVMSHTKAAVDQALYEATKTGAPLADSPEVLAGQILRIGVIPENSDLPLSVRLEDVLERRTRELREQKDELETRAKPLRERKTYLEQVLGCWNNLMLLAGKTRDLPNKIKEAKDQIELAKKSISKAVANMAAGEKALLAAQRAWFGRAGKVARASTEVANAQALKTQLDESLAAWQKHEAQLQSNLLHVEKVFIEQQQICEKLPSREQFEEQRNQAEMQLSDIASALAAIQTKLDHAQQQVISEAKALFCTLTKNYRGDELKHQQFDAVIIDEISMALPPLIFLAAARASKRVILVGDFWQLPPIVRSKNPIAEQRLGQDAFHVAGIVSANNQLSRSVNVVTALRTQQRMRTPIADLARELAYGHSHLLDHESVRTREEKPWLKALPENPLVVVDTAELNSWCGREAGSLSRFNFNSATVAIDIAAMAAASLPKPPNEYKRPIGVVTPYAAQRRLLQRLVEAAELRDWVKVGTVHTFQGGEADLVIFDSVLDEPYWSARLTNPNSESEVRRDINVAITRAREKFVFVGCSDWMNQYAKLPSALGKLWQLLVDHADLIPALDLVNTDFFTRTLNDATAIMGWTPPRDDGKAMFEKLDETTFFPRFTADLRSARKSIFGLAPFFGEYRWPQVQPVFADALKRHVDVTLLTPPPAEARNRSYVEQVIDNLRQLGARIVLTSGLHGKDVIIDERIVYTGSMNWSSNRGRLEEVHRIDSTEYARTCLSSLQVRHIRENTVAPSGSPRTCPHCGYPIRIVNQRANLREWERQPLKIGCTNDECEGYLRPLDERLPFSTAPICVVDGKTKYRLTARGKGKVWKCPKHPSKCPQFKFVPGDGEAPGAANRFTLEAQ
jgi:hypothetical protein